MSYYAIAHLLQGEDNLDGSKPSPSGIKPEQLTDAVYDYIYRNKAYPVDCMIPEETLATFRKEFRTWYPMSLRVSAKDLIPNHLTMALYNHAAVWDDEPELWPRGYYTNGHVQVDAEKMSKSKGNFLMMDECVEMYSCDATRFACADAGDSLEDANFSRETADNAIMSLFTELEWVKEVTKIEEELRGDGEEMVFMDKVFDNSMNRLAKETDKAFGEMRFRDGLKTGWYELVGARNSYRDWCKVSGVKPRLGLFKKFISVLAVIMTPITPHWSEEIWSISGGNGFVVKAPWPVLPDEDKLMTKQSTCLFKSLRQFRLTVQKSKKKVTKATIMVVDKYPDWKVDALVWMQENIVLIDDSKQFMGELKKWTGKLSDKKIVKNVMQFVSFVRKEYMDIGAVAMDQTVPFDQGELFGGSMLKYISSQLNLNEENITICDIGKDGVPQGCKNGDQVGPGKPAIFTRI